MGIPGQTTSLFEVNVQRPEWLLPRDPVEVGEGEQRTAVRGADHYEMWRRAGGRSERFEERNTPPM